MYHFCFHIKEHMPLLAWVAEVDYSGQVVDVYCGEKVACRDSFFVAGVWDGDFSGGAFDKVSFFLGSGMRIGEHGLEAVSASHSLEKIFLYKKPSSCVFSNSLPLILAYAGLSPDEKENQYEAILCSVLDGLDGYRVDIPLAEGKKLEQYFVKNISVSEEGLIEVKDKEAILPFASFEDYYDRMKKALSLIKANAEDEGRPSTFGLVSTISSGYDSCACAAMARKLGCETVVSLVGGKYDKDSGEDVARQLGYNTIVKREQKSYRNKSDNIDAEYLCSGELGTHLQFSVFEDVFADNLVFMGLRGDYYWGKAHAANNRFRMQGFFYYETNIGYIENALKNGYVVVPLPTFGTSQSVSVREITLSPSMKPWSLDNDYDRPIPRRIVESGGGKRESFGQKKSGGGFSMGYDTVKSVRSKMTAEGYSSFVKYVDAHKSLGKDIGRLKNKIKFTCCLTPTYLNYAARKLKMNLRFDQKTLRISNPCCSADLFSWGMAEMTDRYKESLQKGKTDS